MDIRPVDLDDDEQVQALGEVVRRSEIEGRPHAAHFDVDSWVGAMRAPDSGERKAVLAAYQDDAVVGGATVWFPLHDNLDKAWLEVNVDPAARRAGVGSALLEAVVLAATEERRSLLLAGTNVDFERLETHPDRLFAEHRGWSASQVEVVREQRLPVPAATLDAWSARAGEGGGEGAGYRVETHVNRFPDELAESLCVLLAQLVVDAPSGTVDYEEETMTPQRLAERQATVAAMGWDLYESVAVTADGVVAAQSTLGVPRTNPDGHQWGTFVHREHRGHRLGLAVKAANLRELQQRAPHITRVLTQNAETNEAMIAINEEMGYRPVEAAVELTLDI